MFRHSSGPSHWLEVAVPPRSQIVVASSAPETRQRIIQVLDRLGVACIGVSSVAQCRELLAQSKVGLIFCDRRLSDGSFTDVLHAAACNSTAGNARVVLMSCVIDQEEYHAARSAGLFEVIPSPTRPTDLEWMVILAKRAERTGTKRLVSVSPRLSDRVAN